MYKADTMWQTQTQGCNYRKRRPGEGDLKGLNKDSPSLSRNSIIQHISNGLSLANRRPKFFFLFFFLLDFWQNGGKSKGDVFVLSGLILPPWLFGCTWPEALYLLLNSNQHWGDACKCTGAQEEAGMENRWIDFCFFVFQVTHRNFTFMFQVTESLLFPVHHKNKGFGSEPVAGCVAAHERCTHTVVKLSSAHMLGWPSHTWQGFP